MSKINGLALSVAFAASVLFGTAALAEDDADKSPVVSYSEIEASKMVRTLLSNGLADNDAILLMAAAKLMPTMGSVSILKDTAKEGDDDNRKDSDFWSVSDVYEAAAEAAGAASELGKQALALAEANKVSTNEEGCWGYTHYHYRWWYDRWGNYRTRIIWHYC